MKICKLYMGFSPLSVRCCWPLLSSGCHSFFRRQTIKLAILNDKNCLTLELFEMFGLHKYLQSKLQSLEGWQLKYLSCIEANLACYQKIFVFPQILDWDLKFCDHRSFWRKFVSWRSLQLYSGGLFESWWWLCGTSWEYVGLIVLEGDNSKISKWNWSWWCRVGVPFCLAQCNAISVPFCHVRMIYPETDVLRPLLMNLHCFVLFFALLKVKEWNMSASFDWCGVSCSVLLLYSEFRGCTDSPLNSDWAENVAM